MRQVVILQMYFRDGAASAFPVEADFNDRVYAYNKYMYCTMLAIRLRLFPFGVMAGFGRTGNIIFVMDFTTTKGGGHSSCE